MKDNRIFGNSGEVVFLYFALKPLYIMNSGTMQIADFVLVGSVLIFLLKTHGRIHLERKGKSLLLFFGLLVGYQFIDNCIWMVFSGDLRMPRNTLFYIFNLLAFATCIVIGEEIGTSKLKMLVGSGSFVSVLITAAGFIFFPGRGARSTSFFNNPNQLGYYAVVMLTVCILCKSELGKWKRMIIFIVALWAMAASLSKAAILAGFGLMLAYIFWGQRKKTYKQFAICATLIVVFCVAIYVIFYSENSFIVSNNSLYAIRYRILNMRNERDSNLISGRGYGRIFELGVNFIWGMGEGGYERFISMHGLEVHSTFVSLFTCYGLLGLGGYIYIFAKCIGKHKKARDNLVLLLGLFLYSITHNGIRNTLVWLILAVVFLDSHEFSSEVKVIRFEANNVMTGG